MAFKYSLQCDTLPWVGYNVLEEPDVVLGAAREAGYDGVDLPGNPQAVDAREWRARVEGAGLAVPEVLAAWGYYHAGEERNLASTDPAKRAHAVQYAKDTVDLAADLGASFTELCAAQPAVPQLPFPVEPVAALRDNFRQSIREVCAHAAPRGITILLEPLNTYEGLPEVLTTLYQAVNYIDELGMDNLGVQPDVYHMNVEEGSIPDALRHAGSRTPRTPSIWRPTWEPASRSCARRSRRSRNCRSRSSRWRRCATTSGSRSGRSARTPRRAASPSCWSR